MTTVPEAPKKMVVRCAEDHCTEPAFDYARFAMTAVNGTIVVEALLCERHIITMEMCNTGTYLFLRPSTRSDM